MIRAFKAIVFVLAALIGIACVVDYFVAWQQTSQPPILYHRWIAPSYYSEKVLMLLLSYFMVQFIISWFINEYSVRKAEREHGEADIVYEWGRNAVLIILSTKAFAEAIVILFVLSLSWLIGFRVSLSLWYFFIYGVVAGCVGITITGLIAVLHPKHFETTKPLIAISLSYAVAVALILHIIDAFL